MSDYVLKFGTKIVTGSNGKWVGYDPSIPPVKPYVTFEFSSASYDPRTETYGWKTGAEWTQVSSSPNRWRYMRDDTDWRWEFDAGDGRLGFYNANQSGVTYKIVDGNLTGVTDLQSTFNSTWSSSRDEKLGCYNLTEVNLPGVSSVVKGWDAFRDNPSLTKVTLGDMPACIDASFMFINDTSLVNVTLGNMSAVTVTHGMFDNCTSLVTAPNMDTSHVTNADSMFNYCLKLKNVPLYDFSSAGNIGNLFGYCRVLQSVPAFNFGSAYHMYDAFLDCEQLTAIPNFTLATVSSVPSYGFNVSNMFKNCYRVSSGITRIYNKMAAWTGTVAHSSTFTDCGSNTTTGAAELANIPSDWK
jgi:hypothetical protein